VTLDAIIIGVVSLFLDALDEVFVFLVFFKVLRKHKKHSAMIPIG
jgi:hypothetical protein